MSALTGLAAADLLLRLGPVSRALGAAIERQAARAARMHGSAVAAQLYVTDDQARALVAELQRAAGEQAAAAPFELTAEEDASLVVLRRDAAELGAALPLDAVAATAGVNALELSWVVACAAPEVDAAYGRAFGYVVDDLSRSRPGAELLLALTGAGASERLALLPRLGPLGRLRRHGVLAARGTAASELRQELGLAPGVLAFLLGEPGDAGSLFADDEDVALDGAPALPPGVDGRRVRRLAAALCVGELDVAGVWGGDEQARERVAAALASAAGRPLRRFDVRLGAGALPESLRAAAALGAVLWVDADPLADDEPGAAAALEHALGRTAVPLCLSGADPWLPIALLSARRYAELDIEELAFAARRRLWAEALPEADADTAGDLAARFRMGASQVYAAASLARVEASMSSNGPNTAALAGAACATVARRRSYRFATVIKPRRSSADLVLSEALHRQVAEIGSFYRRWPWVAEDWGLGRLAAAPGLRVLFAGEAGTGKTLAAEAIAFDLGLDLLKVNLGRVVSKWVGETERNLEASFDEAEGSASVLFFDEADSLFAKRGEIRHGTDRYANLEVGYLLQRLESYAGLVVLATNLRENLDDAFTRRFNAIVHFPRPGPEERRRIWERALPASAPVDGVDLDALARLDMTGAAIVAAAQTAALLAAEEGEPAIAMRHAVPATARQFRREGRVLSPSELRRHAELL